MINKNNYWIAVIAVALGYFVDLYDILLFSTVRKPSLLAIGIPEDKLLEVGLQLQNCLEC
jgi:MFS transporter, putative metabolite:H+ symporter